MKNIHTLLLIGLALAGLGCVFASNSSEESDYEIYIQFLTLHTWEGVELSDIELEAVVVEQVTSVQGMDHSSEEPWTIPQNIRSHFLHVHPSTIESFESKNRKPLTLAADKFGIHTVTLIGREEVSKLFTGGPRKGGWWPGFYERYPNTQGILTLSRVGISSDGTQALLYYGNQYGGLGGRGELVLFGKDGPEWVITKRVMIWIS